MTETLRKAIERVRSFALTDPGNPLSSCDDESRAAMLALADAVEGERRIDKLLAEEYERLKGDNVYACTKRELFAAKIMASLCAPVGEFRAWAFDAAVTDIAKRAVIFADALLAELDRTKSLAVARDRASNPLPIDNGNVYRFCDYVRQVTDEKSPLLVGHGCVRGAGHNGPHAFAQVRDGVRNLLAPVVVFEGGRS